MSKAPPAGIDDDLGKRDKRKEGFQRSEELEVTLRALNLHLQQAASLRPIDGTLPHRPVLLVGCPRSGSTLITQVLAHTGAFCYPTNILSRFYADPWIGALVHRVLCDLDTRHEIFPGAVDDASTYANELGKTSGPDAPHEFWYWWRRFFRFNATHDDMQPLGEGDRARFRSELGDMIRVFGKPFIGKAMIMNWRIPLLAEILPEAIFLFVERDLEQNACSLLRTRERFYGDRSEWYAFKPAEYERLLPLDPVEQVFAQVHFTNKAVRAGLASLPAERAVRWRFEEFCADPAGHYRRLTQVVGIHGPEPRLEPFAVRESPWPNDVDPTHVAALTSKYGIGAAPTV